MSRRGDAPKPLPAAVLTPRPISHRPPKPGAHRPWGWLARCRDCREPLAELDYGLRVGVPGLDYLRTILEPAMVERPGRDEATGWPRYGLRTAARLKGAPETAGRRGDPDGPKPMRTVAGPIVAYCPNRACGLRQSIDPPPRLEDGDWANPNAPRPLLREVVQQAAANIDHTPKPRAEKRKRPLVKLAVELADSITRSRFTDAELEAAADIWADIESDYLREGREAPPDDWDDTYRPPQD